MSIKRELQPDISAFPALEKLRAEIAKCNALLAFFDTIHVDVKTGPKTLDKYLVSMILSGLLPKEFQGGETDTDPELSQIKEEIIKEVRRCVQIYKIAGLAKKALVSGIRGGDYESLLEELMSKVQIQTEQSIETPKKKGEIKELPEELRI